MSTLSDIVAPNDRATKRKPKAATKRGRTNGLSDKTKFIAWVRAAGRCQYRDCNRHLLGDFLSGNEDAKFGFVAHIVADAPGGPRGDVVRSPLLVNDPDNVMLLCHTHHKLIDVDEVDQHPEQLLRDMKAAHEMRMRDLTDVKEDRASHVLCYGANIGSQESLVAYSRIRNDILPERYPAEGRAIRIEILGSSLIDSDPDFWVVQRQNLRREFNTRVKDRIQQREVQHVSVFALAPQPLLMELGTLLGDIVPADVRQLHREPSTWRWAEDQSAISFVVRRPNYTSGSPALILGLSATILDERVTSVLGPDASIWSITAEAPHNDIMRRRDDLGEFRRLVRLMLNEIKAAHGENAVVRVFPALPVSAAIEVGRVWMPKADLPLLVYDQQARLGGFVEAIQIGGEGAAG